MSKPELPRNPNHYCATCGKALTENEFDFCARNTKRLNGRYLCYKHQPPEKRSGGR